MILKLTKLIIVVQRQTMTPKLYVFKQGVGSWKNKRLKERLVLLFSDKFN